MWYTLCDGSCNIQHLASRRRFRGAHYYLFYKQGFYHDRVSSTSQVDGDQLHNRHHRRESSGRSHPWMGDELCWLWYLRRCLSFDLFDGRKPPNFRRHISIVFGIYLPTHLMLLRITPRSLVSCLWRCVNYGSHRSRQRCELDATRSALQPVPLTPGSGVQLVLFACVRTRSEICSSNLEYIVS